ncbi:MAG: gluconeogenesis factor YvcK family protein, partial [Bacteroidota bacterium]
MSAITGDLQQAVQQSSKVLAVQGKVLPATLDSLVLVARLRDGRIIKGESTISHLPDPIAQVWLEPNEPKALPEAVQAIEEADAIILGPGSLYTSIVPNLLIPEIRQAIQKSRAPKLYVCNVMTQPGETDGFHASDHVRVLRGYGSALFDAVLANRQPPSRLLDSYQQNDQFPVEIDSNLKHYGVKVLLADLLDESALVRHDPNALARAILDWLAIARGEPSMGLVHPMYEGLR